MTKMVTFYISWARNEKRRDGDRAKEGDCVDVGCQRSSNCRDNFLEFRNKFSPLHESIKLHKHAKIGILLNIKNWRVLLWQR